MGRYLLLLLLAKKWVVLGAALAGALAASVFCLLVDRVYSAEVIAVAAAKDEGALSSAGLGGMLGAAGLLSGLGDSADRDTREAMISLTTRSFLEDFITESNLLPVLFADDWDASTGKWKDPDDEPTAWDGYEYFRDHVLSVSEDASRGIFKVTVRWTDPEQAAVWANALVDRVNRITRDRAGREARDSLAFLRKELEATEVMEVRASIFELIETQVQKIMLSNTHPDYALKVIDAARTKQPDAFDYPRLAILVPAGFLMGVFVSLGLLFLTHLPAQLPGVAGEGVQ